MQYEIVNIKYVRFECYDKRERDTGKSGFSMIPAILLSVEKQALRVDKTR